MKEEIEELLAMAKDNRESARGNDETSFNYHEGRVHAYLTCLRLLAAQAVVKDETTNPNSSDMLGNYPD